MSDAGSGIAAPSILPLFNNLHPNGWDAGDMLQAAGFCTPQGNYRRRLIRDISAAGVMSLTTEIVANETAHFETCWVHVLPWVYAPGDILLLDIRAGLGASQGSAIAMAQIEAGAFLIDDETGAMGAASIVEGDAAQNLIAGDPSDYQWQLRGDVQPGSALWLSLQLHLQETANVPIEARIYRVRLIGLSGRQLPMALPFPLGRFRRR